MSFITSLLCPEHTHIVNQPAVALGLTIVGLIAARAVGLALASWVRGGRRGRR